MPRKPKYRRPYPPEFRREAVALYARTDRTLGEIAADLGVSRESLRLPLPCPGANAAKAGQLNLRTALARSPFAGRIPAVLREAHELLFDGPQKRLSQS